MVEVIVTHSLVFVFGIFAATIAIPRIFDLRSKKQSDELEFVESVRHPEDRDGQRVQPRGTPARVRSARFKDRTVP